MERVVQIFISFLLERFFEIKIILDTILHVITNIQIVIKKLLTSLRTIFSNFKLHWIYFHIFFAFLESFKRRSKYFDYLYNNFHFLHFTAH